MAEVGSEEAEGAGEEAEGAGRIINRGDAEARRELRGAGDGDRYCQAVRFFDNNGFACCDGLRLRSGAKEEKPHSNG